METCKICSKEFKNLKSLITHVKIKHNFLSKEYYDKYIKKEGEGECVVCSKKTTYRNAGIGYLKTCSVECRSLSKEFIEKQSNAKKGKKQSKETIYKRIKNTNQLDKEKIRKQTMLDRYGVDNPTKLDSIKKILSEKNKGKILIRTDDWQNNIIESKRKNGTLKHTDKTKKKISDKLNKFYSLNLDREKYISKSNNVNHLSGWYNGLYFRSSLELSFLVHNRDKCFTSCENNKYKIIYNDNNKQRSYYPDFTDGEIIFEIKPTGLLNTHINKLKIQEGVKVYGENYKIITEVESPYITKDLIRDLINSGEVKLTNRSKKVLEKYKF
jgi:hypothetical protein